VRVVFESRFPRTNLPIDAGLYSMTQRLVTITALIGLTINGKLVGATLAMLPSAINAGFDHRQLNLKEPMP
jgi:hypothetical protein